MRNRSKLGLPSRALLLAGMLAAAIGITTASAQTAIDLVVTPSSAIFDANNVSGVSFDAAPDFESGSFASNGVDKTDMYFVPTALFDREVTLGEIARMSYWTKKGSTHAVDAADWYLTIYTKPFEGDLGPWYGERIGAEPYFSMDLDDPADTWNQWSTDGAANRLRFFESTLGYFGGYADPDWASFVSGNGLSGEPYADHEILFFSIQTGSAWAAGFTGQIDGLRIELTDGSVANVNFENPTPPADKESCKQGGWQQLTREDGSAFKNQGACIAYVNGS